MLLGFGSGHPTDDRGTEFIGAGRMPVHDLADDGKGSVCHHWPVLVFDLVEQPHHLAALDLGDWAFAKAGIDKPLYRGLVPIPASELLAFALKVVFADGLEGDRASGTGITASFDFTAGVEGLGASRAEGGCGIGAEGNASAFATTWRGEVEGPSLASLSNAKG